MRLAARSPSARRAEPPQSTTTFSPDVSASATSRAGVGEIDGAGVAPSPHEASAGRMSVATSPGGEDAAATASAAARATPDGDSGRCTQVETLRATVAMSDCSGAS